MQPLPTEIVMLGIGVVQMFLQSVSSAFEVGGEYKAGSRDDARVVRGKFAGRADRAFAICWRLFRRSRRLRWH